MPWHGRRHQRQPQETITVVPHAPCHSDPEEEQVTIITQATPQPRQAQGQVVVQVPGILVTDITSGEGTHGGEALQGTTLPPLPGRAGPHHTPTTTTTSHGGAPALPTTPGEPTNASAKAPAPLRWPRGVPSQQEGHARPRGTSPTYTTAGEAASPSSSLVTQAGAALGDTEGGHSTALTVHGLAAQPETAATSPPRPAPRPGHCEDATTPAHHLTTTPSHHFTTTPAHHLTTTPAHHLTSTPSGVVDASPDMAFASCSFCRSVPGGGNTLTSLSLMAPLPHSLLEPAALLHCLGVAPPAAVSPTDAASQATLCQECHALLCEGDQAYHHLMEVMGNMRQRWAVPGAGVPGVPAPVSGQDARRLRPILPKPSGPVWCGLCGARLARAEEWHHHATTQHRLSPRWRSPRLQAALKACLARELQRGSGQQGARRCPACCRSFPRQEEFVKHLQGHHSMAVEQDFAAGLGGAARAEQREREGDTWLGRQEEQVVKEEEVHDEEDIVKDKEEMTGKRERTVKEEEHEEEEEEVVVEEEVEEEVQLNSGIGSLVEEEPAEPCPEECAEESRGGGAGGGRRSGGRWRCRVCAAVFGSQRQHDVHKAAAHPGSVRARRGGTRSAAPHGPSGKGSAGDGAQQDTEQPATCREGTIVILEGDGRGGVTHHRLQPTTTTASEARQDTTSRAPGASGFPCPACTRVFADRLALVRHRRASHPGPGDTGPGDRLVLVECPLCGRRLAGPPALQHHMARVHRRPSHASLRHRCRLCLCQCHTRPQLERHMRERHGAPPPPPPVQCGRCGKMYSARYIDSHMANMHGDAARFPCTFCPMKFGARAGLRAHVSLEHANTTWACQECPMQFAKYHQLRQHRLYVHSRAEHRCPECPRAFKRRGDLTEHAKRCHRERRPQECSFCPKVYSDRKRLRMHLMRKHGVAWEDTLAHGYARRQRENNCLRRRQQQRPHSPGPQQPPREESEGCQGDMLEGQQEYSVVHLTQAPHPLTDTISYIILEEA